MAGPLTDIRWMAFQNVSSSLTIPAFAPMQALGTTIKDGLTLVIECDQVGSAANPDFNLNIIFNGPVAIGPGGYGRCARGGDDCQCLWDTGTPSPGDVWGIKPGQFSLTKNGVGKFIVDGIVDSGTERMYGRWEGITALLTKYAGSTTPMTPGNTGTFNVWYGAARQRGRDERALDSARGGAIRAGRQDGIRVVAT